MNNSLCNLSRIGLGYFLFLGGAKIQAEFDQGAGYCLMAIGASLLCPFVPTILFVDTNEEIPQEFYF